MACSVASEPCLLQRWCVCRLILERRRGGHGTGRSVGMVSIRIGEAARWWCQDRVTALGMVAGDSLRHDVHVHPHRQGGEIVVPGMGHGLGWCPSASVKLSVARNGSRPWMVAGDPLRHDVHVHPHRPGGKMVVPCSSAKTWMVCSVASEPLLLQRWCLLQKKLLFCYFCKIRIKKCAMLLQYE